jgi:putative transposase
MLPHDFPPYSTVYYYFRRWHKRGRGEQINQLLREQIRMKQGSSPQATAAIVDSQKGYTTEKKGKYPALTGAN